MSENITAADLAAANAAQAAFRQLTIEIWTLYSIAMTSTILRTYARIRAVGIKDLRADDYLIWIGVLFYSAQSALGYSIGNAANGLANNSMTDEQRAALSPNDPEYHFRILGSQIQVAGWAIYSTLITFLKLSMLAFFIRLTDGLGRPYRIRIWIGFSLVIGTYVAAIAAIFIGCRPFHRYWQINPDPGNACQAAVSRPIIWVSFAANVITDIYLILIPLPMLWGSTLRMVKKVASTIVLGAGIFVLVCATLKSIFVLVDPVNGPQLAGSWGIREAFTAVMTTNLPMIFPLFKNWLKPYFGTMLRSSQKTYQYNTPGGFHTIGGGVHGAQSRDRRGGSSSHVISGNMTFNDSEERIVDEVKMQNIMVTAAAAAAPAPEVGEGGRNHQPAKGIMVSNQVEVTHEDRQSHNSDQNSQRPHETW